MSKSQIFSAKDFNLASFVANTQENTRLPNLGADADSITMSGFSSGSFMTNIQALVHSDKIKGIGLLSGGPYGTWPVSYYWQDAQTLKKVSRNLIKKYENLGLIQNTTNIKNMPVYIHSGGDFDVIV